MNLLSLCFSGNTKEVLSPLGDSHALKHTIFPQFRDFILYSLLDPSPDLNLLQLWGKPISFLETNAVSVIP
jgi:hypothetical protein